MHGVAGSRIAGVAVPRAIMRRLDPCHRSPRHQDDDDNDEEEWETDDEAEDDGDGDAAMADAAGPSAPADGGTSGSKRRKNYVWARFKMDQRCTI